MPRRLYLLEGEPDAAGWKALRADHAAKKVELVTFDPDRWALVEDERPPQYDGMEPADPADGMYLDHLGRPVYVVGLQQVDTAYDVIDALGEAAREAARALLDELGDPDIVLERLGRSF